MRTGTWAALACAAVVGGCATTAEVVRFQPRPTQEALMRDGQPALVSKGRLSVVSIRPAARQLAPGARPVFVVQMQNVSRKPIDFRIANVRATQKLTPANSRELRVYSYDELAAQERSAQIGRALLVGVIGGLNSASARGYYGQAVAADQNAQLAAATAAAGERNLAELEAQVMKDHTIMPGETHAGAMVIEAPVTEGGPKAYAIEMMVGEDHHQMEVVHEGAAAGS
jgi:hypothetical protein